MIHQNSIASYHALDLTKRQAEVVSVLETLGEATDRRIADYLGFDINQVTGRITELRNMKAVIEDHNIVGKFGRTVRVCKLVFLGE